MTSRHDTSRAWMAAESAPASRSVIVIVEAAERMG
jgi:hypothetical protein